MGAGASIVGILVAFRARVVALVGLGGYFLLVAALGGHETGWRRIGVPAETPRFDDLRNLTSSWECTRRGIAVLPVNPCDFHRRPADFPQIWLLPSHFGLGLGDTFALGLAQGSLFLLAALFVLPVGASLWSGLVYLLFLCSPAVMLGVERENPDLILFPIVLLAVLVATRRARGESIGGLLVLVAAVLKLYPIFALGFLVRRATRSALRVAVVVAGGFVVYALATIHYIHKMLSAIPAADTFAYGVRRVSEWFSLAAAATIHTLEGYRAWDAGLVLVAIGIAWFVARRLELRPALPADPDATRDLDLFWAGACVYVGSYAIFRSNDYRLIFLLLTVPQLVRWASDRHLLAFVSLPAMIVVLWLNEWTGMPGVHVVLDWWNRTTAIGNSSFPLPLVVIAQFVLFVVFLVWLLATVSWPYAGRGTDMVPAE
ncbi:MAG TPA: glycosyltransferase 87 family protein [Gaiellaceae bacterium]|nr:glycosyltransferase 87 family protein [Gaiellaceae bacterium]